MTLVLKNGVLVEALVVSCSGNALCLPYRREFKPEFFVKTEMGIVEFTWLGLCQVFRRVTWHG
jgi:hypothetical protein